MTFTYTVSLSSSSVADQLVSDPDNFIAFLNLLADKVVGNNGKVPEPTKIARRLRSMAGDTKNMLVRERQNGLQAAIGDILDGVSEERSAIGKVLEGADFSDAFTKALSV